MTPKQTIQQVYPHVNCHKITWAIGSNLPRFQVYVNGISTSFGVTRYAAWKEALVWYNNAIQKRLLRKLES